MTVITASDCMDW